MSRMFMFTICLEPERAAELLAEAMMEFPQLGTSEFNWDLFLRFSGITGNDSAQPASAAEGFAGGTDRPGIRLGGYAQVAVDQPGQVIFKLKGNQIAEFFREESSVQVTVSSTEETIRKMCAHLHRRGTPGVQEALDEMRELPGKGNK